MLWKTQEAEGNGRPAGGELGGARGVDSQRYPKAASERLPEGKTNSHRQDSGYKSCAAHDGRGFQNLSEGSLDGPRYRGAWPAALPWPHRHPHQRALPQRSRNGRQLPKKENRLATLVGTRTAGEVLGGAEGSALPGGVPRQRST